MKLKIYCFQDTETMYDEAEKFDEKLVIDGGSHSDLMNTALDIIKNGCEKPIFTHREEFLLLIGVSIYYGKIVAENVDLRFYEDGEIKQSGFYGNGMIYETFSLGYFMGNHKEFVEKLKEI